MSQSFATNERVHHDRGDCFLLEECRAHPSGIQVPIDARKGFALRDFVGRWKVRRWHAAVQARGEEEPGVISIDVWEPAPGCYLPDGAQNERKISRSHKRERGTHECVRHHTGRKDR
jgi:hypothetical protein